MVLDGQDGHDFACYYIRASFLGDFGRGMGGPVSFGVPERSVLPVGRAFYWVGLFWASF